MGMNMIDIDVFDIFISVRDFQLDIAKEIFVKNYPIDTYKIDETNRYIIFKDLKATSHYVDEYIDMYQDLTNENKFVGGITDSYNNILAVLSYRIK